MHFGVQFICTDETIPPDEAARAAEDLGFESMFLSEQVHIPASRLSPWPGGGDLPRHFYRTVEPFVALSMAAAATTTIKVGTGICLVVQHDPISLAKRAATLDHFSGGRFIFGVGAGWNREQMANHGTDFATRFRLMRERVLAIKMIWTEELAEFHGEYVDFDPIYCWPKPIQRPHPPVLVGGTGPRVLERVVDIGDGWFPNPRNIDVGEVERQMAQLRDLADERGVPAPTVSLLRVPPDPSVIERLRELGVERCVFGLPSADRDEVLRTLDKHASVVAQLSGT